MSENTKMLRREKIAKVAAMLAELKAADAKEIRKERNGKMMALGIIVYNHLANASDDFTKLLTKLAESQANERIKQRALSAIKDFENDKSKEDTPKKEPLEKKKPETMTSSSESSLDGKHYLNVPFEDKDEAKSLGAKYDPVTKKWFIMDALDDKSKFSKWL